MIFLKGDIVELIQLNEYNGERAHIGWRYRVENSFDNLVKVKIKNYHFQGGEALFNHSQIFLYKRPIINWIKYVWKIVT